jgi:hypothetical protein
LWHKKSRLAKPAKKRNNVKTVSKGRTFNDTSQGWVPLPRSIRDHWVWNDAEKLKWFLDIYLECNHTSRKINIGYQVINCERGQTINSLQTWAKRWRSNKNTVRRFFKMLQDDEIIRIENVQKTTRITVCNYDSYDGSRNDTGTIQGRKRYDAGTIQGHDSATNNNDNNGNNDKNDKNGRSIAPPAIEFARFWDLYDKKVGKEKAEKLWLKLTDEERENAMNHIPGYKRAQADKQYRKDPATYLRNKSFNDEIISSDGRPKNETRSGKPTIESNIPAGSFFEGL